METPLIETQIVLSVPEQNLEPSILASIQGGFQDFFAQAEDWRKKAVAIRVTSADQKGEMKLARTCRLELKNIRVEAEKTRKRLKEDSLRMGKAIDGINNLLLAAIVPLEKYLEDQEKYGERLEAERIEKLSAEREAIIAPFLGDGQPVAALGMMSGEAWNRYLDDARLLHEAKQERARKEEAERIAREQAEAAERLRIQAENERLKKEAAEKEEALRLEREAVEKARLEAEAKAKSEREAAEIAARKERERIEAAAAEERRIASEKAKAERQAIEEEARKEKARLEAVAAEERAKAKAAFEAQAKIERENAARLAQEKAEREAKAAAEKKAAQAPDKDKLMAFARTVRAIKVPSCKSGAAIKVAEEIQAKVDSFAKWIETQASVL